MNTLQILTYLVWLVASVTFILALKFLASPRTARTGNLLGAAGMALVVAWTFFIRDGQFAIPSTWWIIVVGGGDRRARRLARREARRDDRHAADGRDLQRRGRWRGRAGRGRRVPP